MSGIGHVVEGTRRARDAAEVAITKATTVHSQEESKVASLAAQAEASTAQVVGALSKRLKEVAVHSEAQTLRVVGSVTQRLEKEIEVAAVSAAMMSERNTRSAVDGLCDEFKAHLDQNLTELERQQGETRQSVEKVAASLEELTRQMNYF